MKRLLSIVCAVALFLMACSGCSAHLGAQPNPGLAPKPLVKVYHVDVDFTDTQYTAIKLSGAVWEKYANGWLHLTFVKDLDTNDEDAAMNKCEEEGCIIKSSSYAPIIEKLDVQAGGQVLGLVTEKSIMLLVEDRLQHPRDFYEVSMHELGHMFGLDHVKDKHAVMYYAHNAQAHLDCPTQSDMSEFCRASGCSLRTVEWCD